MPLELLGFQETIKIESRVALRTHNSILLQLATGGGKTVIAAFIIQAALRLGIPVKFMCHRSELLLQTGRTMDKLGLPYGFIAAGIKPDYTQLFQICSVKTAINRKEFMENKGIIIWDEGHHCTSPTWRALKAYFNKCKHILMTATPELLSGVGMIEVCSYMVKGPPPKWLISHGYLSDFIYYAPKTVDLSHIHMLGGEYRKDELEEELNKSSVTGDAIAHWKKYAPGMKTILFEVSIKRSEYAAQRFRDAGIMAIHIDGNTHESLRRKASIGLANGDIEIICNVNLCGEGYDLSALAGQDVNIECVIDSAPTMSLARKKQRDGRALRIKSYKAVIIDMVGNAINPDDTLKHGFPDDDYEWTLEGKKRTRKSMTEQQIMTRQCPKCQGTHRAAMICPYCGYVYDIQARSIEEKEGELEEIDRDKARKALKVQVSKARTIDQLIALGRSKGYGGGSEAGLIRWANYKLSGRAKAASKYRRGW